MNYLKIIFWCTQVIFLASCGASSSSDFEKEKETERAEAHCSAISNLIDVHDANFEWSKEYRFNEKRNYTNIVVSTADLQRKWPTGQNVAFFGLIDDYSSVSDEDYRVIFRTSLNPWNHSLFEKVGLDVLANKDKIDGIISSNGNIFTRSPVGKPLALVVIAKISGVETAYVGGGDELKKAWFGKGELTDIYLLDGLYAQSLPDECLRR